MSGWQLGVVAGLAITGCGGQPSALPPAPPSCEGFVVEAPACNGSAELCDRRYDEVSHATTHNAMSSAEDGWLAPNQRHDMLRQLHDGVRALMIDTHVDDREDVSVPSLCHGSCLFGALPLHEALRSFESFLRCNPEQVLTLIVEAYVSPQATADAFEQAGLTDYAYAHDPATAWPTLGEMIARDERLVVLSDDGGYPSWYMNVWDHAFETPFAAKTLDDLVCETNRGSVDNPLFILNHFLTAPLADESLAEQVNHNPFFMDRARACQDKLGRLPNFPTVDFYSIGDLLDVTVTLNGP